MIHPFTPTYIAMAKAAEEIQAMRPANDTYQLGDWYAIPKFGPYAEGGFTDLIKCLGGSPGNWDTESNSVDMRFLPRLDQLLGMLGGPDAFMQAAASVGRLVLGRYEDFADWHELALAVVMRERLGKLWRDGEWVKV